jgi:hypothetical protein
MPLGQIPQVVTGSNRVYPFLGPGGDWQKQQQGKQESRTSVRGVQPPAESIAAIDTDDVSHGRLPSLVLGSRKPLWQGLRVDAAGIFNYGLA